MKFTYAYKTSNGTRHEASIDAPSREEVFSTLRAQGIRPIKVVAADGSKANGESVGRGVPDAPPTGRAFHRPPHQTQGTKHKALIPLILIGLVGLALYSPHLRATLFPTLSKTPSPTNDAILTGTTRRQVIGDVAIIEKGIRTGWSDVFTSKGDRFLASFAIPGVKAGVRNTSVEEIEHALREPLKIDATDSLEAKQIKSMVEGMKDEARSYLAAGGTIIVYGRRLTERQDAEIAIRKRIEAEVLNAQKTMPTEEFESFYEKRNNELRNLGIKPIVLPES